MVKQIKYYITLSLVTLGLCATTIAQDSGSLGNVGINENATLSVFSKHTFSYGGNILKAGIIKTSRTGNKGFLHFAKNSSWEDANELQHVDGYVSTSKSTGFTFPIGHNGNYRPIAVKQNANGVKAAYYNINPKAQTGNPVNPEITKVSDVEYWDISGSTDAMITLTWDRQSDVRSLADYDVNKLTIVGWNGYQWEVIPSNVDPISLNINASNGSNGVNRSSLLEGSISSVVDVNLNDYELFSLGTLNPEFSNFVQNQNLYNNDEIGLFVYPSPASRLEDITVTYTIDKFEEARIEVLDMSGQLLYTKALNRAVGMESLEPDFIVKSSNYFIRITTKTSSAVLPVVIVD